MKSYQYYIFLSSIIIILVSFGFRLLYIVDNNLKNIKNNTIENFKDTSDALVMPDIYNNKKNKNQFPDVDIPLGKPIPGDERKYLESDKVYINPFYPENKPSINPTQNYPNPNEMTTSERNAFKYGYPNQMTMQDYVNWLSLFRLSPDLLNLDHNINYQKLIKNVPIEFKENITPPPAKRLPPLVTDDYFLNMYTQNPTQPDPMFTQTINQDTKVASNLGDPSNGIIAYNYNQYPDFKQNFNVMGNSQHIYNNELAFKTDPFFLKKYLGPTMLVKEPKLSDK